MRALAHRLWTVVLAGLLAVVLAAGSGAQTADAEAEEDKGFLTRTLQDLLSGAGRDVRIDGFQGALSSTASFARMTIADEDGVWLTLTDARLEWNRSALLRGRLEVAQLSAARLDLPRLPAAQEDALPEAEAQPFALPDLPVAVEIQDLSIDEINLGAPLLGSEAQLALQAQAVLNSDLAQINLSAERSDGQTGRFAIETEIDRAGEQIDLLLELREGAGGLAARLLNIPGQPSVDLRVDGSGPFEAFRADVMLATDGTPRLSGAVTLASQAPRRPSGSPDRRIQADIGGDITAVLAPRYRAFFGEDVRLQADALIEGTGAVELSRFALQAQAAQLEGRLALDAGGWPSLIDISGRIASPDGSPVLLPVGGDGTTVAGLTLDVEYDASDDAQLTANFDMQELNLGAANLGAAVLTLDGALEGAGGTLGRFDGDLSLEARRLALVDPALAEAVGTQVQLRSAVGYAEGQALRLSDLQLVGEDYNLTGEAEIAGVETGLATQLDAQLVAADLSRFSALAGRALGGQSQLALRGQIVPLSGAFDLSVTGEAQDLSVDVPQADAVLAGQTDLSFAAVRDEAGTRLRDLALRNAALDLTGQADLRSGASRAEAQFRLSDLALVVPQYSGPVTAEAVLDQRDEVWSVDAQVGGPYDIALTLEGPATGPQAALRFAADVPRLSALAEGVPGGLSATGVLRPGTEGWQIESAARGPYSSDLSLRGALTPALDLRYDLALAELVRLVPQLPGTLQSSGRVRQTTAGFDVDLEARAPYGITAQVAGLATGPNMQLSFETAMPNVRPLVPGVSGPLSANGVLRQTPEGISVETTAAGPYSAQASVQGVVTGDAPAITYQLSLPNVGALVEQINGPLRLTGAARKAAGGWQVETDAAGPSGTTARLDGRVGDDGRLDLDLNGSAPLGLSRPFLAPRDLQGLAQFDLAVNGPAALSSVSGTIRTSNARFSAPNLRLSLEGITADVALSGNRAEVDVQGTSRDGGSLRAGGSVGLTGALPADIAIAMQDLVLIDPRLYRTSVTGALNLAGPLRGGAGISGQVNVGETVVTVPSTGLTSIGDIPPINHIGATRPVMSTLRKAGLNETAGEETTQGGGAGFGLNLRVSAPNRIFVRGRGLDAELGGALTLTGSTARIISAGRFDLLRGRLDILGQRFDLTEGGVQFQGDLLPYIRLISTTSTASSEISIIVDGPADAPQVTFASSPEAPQDEVLAQLLFGRNISEISAFQALQLANAVATLAGRGGVNVIDNLRSGFALDDLDVTTTEDGATAVRAGKYISENIYTDVTAASDGTGEVSLNLDITPNLKGKATLGSDGDTGIGIFFEKDY